MAEEPAGWRRVLRDRLPALLDDLAGLVGVESPSSDPEATARCAEAVAALGRRVVGTAPETLDVDGRRHLRWVFGAPRVLLLGHFDTVWPARTLERWPFDVDDERATGPGVFDMKAGIVLALHGLSLLDDLDGVAVLLTGDEEVGSPSSRRLVEDTARGLDACLVLEPSQRGALKTARKGISLYRVEVRGRAAHAGLEPERGANALAELAEQIRAVARLARPATGTTVTPTLASAGTAVNVVPAHASVDVDVRAATREEQERVEREIHELTPTAPGTLVTVTGGINRPPMTTAASAGLFARAQAVAGTLGLDPPGGAQVGGGSDGNFTAALGTPTLDGLGAVGDGAHAEGEHVVVPALPDRAALVGALVADLLDR